MGNFLPQPFLVGLKHRRGQVHPPAHCPTCGHVLPGRAGPVRCQYCSFTTDWLIAYQIPNRFYEPCVELAVWPHPEHGLKSHASFAQGVTAEDVMAYWKLVLVPLAAIWAHGWIADGLMTEAQADNWMKCFVAGPPYRDMAKEIWEERQEKEATE